MIATIAAATIFHPCHLLTMVAEKLVIAYTVFLRCFLFNPALMMEASKQRAT
jgi:hypothetical protein